VLAIQPNAAPKVLINFVPRGQHNCADEECPPGTQENK
jgi:hypothetical protein